MAGGEANSVSRRIMLYGGAAALALLPELASAQHPAQPLKLRPGLEREATEAYNRLISQNPGARAISERSLAVLIFPKITKAGFMVGGQHGKGVLRERGRTTGYYESTGVSVGLQFGGQTFSNCMFFMNQSALDYLKKSNGWSIGTGPTVVVADKGFAKEASTSTLKDDIYAFIFGQEGLMAGIGLQGTKITPFK